MQSKSTGQFSRGCHYQYHHCHHYILNGIHRVQRDSQFHKIISIGTHNIVIIFMDALLWGVHVCLCVQKERWMRTEDGTVQRIILLPIQSKPAYMSWHVPTIPFRWVHTQVTNIPRRRLQCCQYGKRRYGSSCC
jgi:hypothetical protein